MSAQPNYYDPDDAVWIEPEPLRPGTLRMRRWRRANRERARIQSQVAMHRTKARRAGVGALLTVAEWLAILDRYGWRCLACADRPDSLTIDCVKPMSRGGALRADNVQPLCRSCNSRKGLRMIDYRRDYARSRVD